MAMGSIRENSTLEVNAKPACRMDAEEEITKISVEPSTSMGGPVIGHFISAEIDVFVLQA